MDKQSHKIISAAYIRNFVFGVEDSLISTVSLLSGITIAGVQSKTIFVTGFILIFVEAFSMAIGSFVSEHSAEDYLHKKDTPTKQPVLDGAIMFFSYFISGFIPLFPYIVAPIETAFGLSVLLSLVALFFLGVFRGRVSRLSIWRNGLRMLAIGGIAITVGILVGKLVGRI